MIKTRDQLEARDTWRLEDLYASEEAWEEAFQRAQRMVSSIPAYEGRLNEPESLKRALDGQFGAERVIESLFCYARMRRDEDNTLAKYQALTDRAQTLLVRFSTVCAYLAPELLALPEGYLVSVAGMEGFGAYRVYLKRLIRQRPHTLSAAEERIVAMAGEMAASPSTIYDMLTDADMKFPSVYDEQGNEQVVTQSSFIPLMMSRNRAVRKAAYESLYSTYQKFGASIPAIYAASVKADSFAAGTGRYEGALQAALFPDEIPRAVYENLIEAVHRHLDGLNRYLRLNARLIGLDNPAMYDIYVPATGGFEINLPFDPAYEMVCDCLGALGKDYVDVLREAREKRWIDPYETRGKSAGAYSWGTYDAHPYVLLNYHETLDGLLTIAHEMGHSMHSYLSNRNQPYPNAGYSLFVAEVASTVNEVLVLMELLQKHTHPQAQAYLLNNLLDSYRATVFRQTMFAEFEKITHEMAEAGEALTLDSLNAAYARLNQTYYGSLEQTDLIAYEWMRIPHFYRAFYVYKYATGFSAATAIAQMIRSEGAPAVERYHRFLSAGSSVSPLEALKLAGIDMRSPAPVEQALELFDRLLVQYEKITAETVKAQ